MGKIDFEKLNIRAGSRPVMSVEDIDKAIDVIHGEEETKPKKEEKPKSKKKKATANTPTENFIRTTISVPKGLHKSIKIAAVKREMTIAKFLLFSALREMKGTDTQEQDLSLYDSYLVGE